MMNDVSFAHEIQGLLWVAIPVLGLFGLCEWLFRCRGVDGEVTRKVSHVGSGLIVFFLPWLVHSHLTVLVLSVGFVVVLGLSKRWGWLPSIHRVSRETRGAQYYPLAVYLTFLLADGDPLLFGVPVLVMALSDTGAAIVGQRYGIIRYRVLEDYRSLEGSLTFFGLTFAVVLVGLGVAGSSDLPSVLLITLLTALVATAVEGISVRGVDNLLVPYATFLVLRATVGLGRDGLGEWVLGTAMVLCVLLMSYRQARLNVTGFMAVFVGGVLAWGLGGAAWLAVLAVPYIGYAATQPLSEVQRAGDLRVMVPGFAVSLFLILLYGHMHAAILFLPFVASVASVSAIALSGFARAYAPDSLLAVLAAFLGAAGSLLPLLFLEAPLSLNRALVGLVLSCAMVAYLLVRELEGRSFSPALVRLVGVLSGTALSTLWAVVPVFG